MSDKKVTFGRVFWPSLVAALIVSLIGVLLWIIVIGSFISGFDTDTSMKVKKNTVLHMTLNGDIGDRSDDEFDPAEFKMSHRPGIAEIIHALESAQTNDKIKGVFMEIDAFTCGFATADEIRAAIDRFEESGKFVVAYNSGEYVSPMEYYIASAANENYGFPTSNIQFLGIGAELSFFKKSLEKLDVEMQIIRGSNNDFKSAVEPFFRENMSDSSRVQIERYINGLWDEYLKNVSAARGVSVKELDRIAENALIQDIEDAVKYKLVDATKYRDEVIDIIAEKAGTPKDKEVELLSFEKYAKKTFYQDQILTKTDDPNVAVILAEGAIGKNGGGLTSVEICKLFREARANESVKTIVFRVNSPGGSALASDEIWREVKLTNEKKKVIVSMGNVAASGGYYVSSAASYIFAEPTTITGSIGVFGMIPYTGALMENKLGITFDRVATNKHSVLTTNRKLTDEEMALIQKNVDKIYDDFKTRVSEGRNMSKDQVEVIARGRVWTGADAKKIGLVDELGGLQDAIDYAAEKAGIKESKVLFYPIVKQDKLGELLEQLEEKESAKISWQGTTTLPPSLIKYYEQLKSLETIQGMQMRMPYEITIE